MNEPLTDKNFLLFCAKKYDSRHCSSVEEFNEDLRRIKYIKKLIFRYEKTGILKERLILNHIMILNNVFGAENTARILYLKLKNKFKYIKPFLLFLNILPQKLYNVNDELVVDMDYIDMDQRIIEELRKI